MDELKATIAETVFRNDENGYSVVQTRAGREHVTVVGILPEMAAGEAAVFQGQWMSHPQYGKQFKAVSCDIEKPSTLRGIERYLASGLIRGVGPATAKLIVEEFGLKAMDVLSEKPERLCEISGIGQKRARQIADSFREQYGARQAMVFLQTYGVPPGLAMRISKKYGDQVQNVVRENPYRMVDDVEGVGFLTADRIALSLGMPVDGAFRMRAGLKHVLTEAAVGSGHTWLPRRELLGRASQLLRVHPDVMAETLRALLLSRELVSDGIDEEDCVFLPAFFRAESEIARLLLSLMSASQIMMPGEAKRRIEQFEREDGIAFSREQRQAALQAVESGVLVITGGPGTGKTTLINCILSLLSGSGEVLLAAPTGRAAKRMTEATGREAKTLHRLLEYGGDEGVFQKNEENPLDCACVIVDEMSMVDIFLMRSLLRALQPGTRLLLVGDADQLPSVGAGNVLGDILKSHVIPSVRLSQIFRQEGQSLIVQNAHSINHGDLPVLNRRDSDFFFERQSLAEDAARAIVTLCQTRLPKYLETADGVRAIQVLSPTKKGACGVLAINRLLQAALNPEKPGQAAITYGDTTFRKGDKVMHVKNNYQLEWQTLDGVDGQGVFNGDVGFVCEIDASDRTVTVLYDDERKVIYEYQQLEELELAYCLSVHKSQGSEFQAVVLPVVGGPPMLLTRNLFYTALTRARRLVVLVGREEAIAAMVHNDHIDKRYTALAERLLRAPGAVIC